MSRSKKAAQAVPASRGGGDLFLRDGRLRAGWALAISLAVLAAVTVGLRAGLNALLDGLFGAWNLRPDNVARSPGWARLLYTWRDGLVALVMSGAMLALCGPLRRLWGLKPCDTPSRPACRWALIGLGVALLTALISLLPDSSRLCWPLSAPRFHTALLPMFLISLAGVLAEEAFTKRVLLEGVKGRWGSHWAVAVSCVAFLGMRAAWTGGWVYAANALLTGLVCCLLNTRCGLWAAVGFRWTLEAACAYLLGFGGGSVAVYRLYCVSETLLTGGDRGPLYGLWLTAALVAMLLWHIRAIHHRQS